MDRKLLVSHTFVEGRHWARENDKENYYSYDIITPEIRWISKRYKLENIRWIGKRYKLENVVWIRGKESFGPEFVNFILNHFIRDS